MTMKNMKELTAAKIIAEKPPAASAQQKLATLRRIQEDLATLALVGSSTGAKD